MNAIEYLQAHQKMSDKISIPVVAASLSAPAWMPSLTDVSSVATVLLPILGAAWLFVQIGIKILEFVRDNRELKYRKVSEDDQHAARSEMVRVSQESSRSERDSWPSQ